MKVGFYTGSFDPFTNGHLYVIKEASKIFDTLIVCIITNRLKKKRTYSKIEMKSAIEGILKREKISNVKVIIYNGSITRVAIDYKTTFFVRGIRDESDYRFEEKLAQINKKLIGIDTVFFRGKKIRSTEIREMIKKRKDVKKYLPPEVMEVVERTNKRRE